MLPAMARLLQRIFSDHLEGGEWSDVSAEERTRLIGVPKHNKYSESIFGHLDRIMKEKPNISAIASEAYIMFSHNKTMEWLDAKTANEKVHIFQNARRSLKDVRKSFQARKLEIQAACRASVMKKLAHGEELNRKRLQRKDKQTLAIMYWGLWQSVNQVDEYLATLQKKSEEKKALTAQLNFRKNVLKQKAAEQTDNLYAFSKNKKALTVEELAFNLKKLISQSLQESQLGSSSGDTSTGHDPILVGKRIRHLCSTDDGEEAWWTGKVISQVSCSRSLTVPVPVISTPPSTWIHLFIVICYGSQFNMFYDNVCDL